MQRIAKAMVILFVIFAPALFACGSDPPAAERDHYTGPDTLTIASTDVRVVLSTRGYGMRIEHPDGRVVLETFAGDRAVAGDVNGAYGSVGATHRDTELRPSLVEGFDHAVPTDARWLHAMKPVSATADGRRATVTLVDPAEPEVKFAIDVAVDGPDVSFETKVRDERDGAPRLNLVGQTFLASPDEKFAGLGEREGSVNHRGHRHQCWVEEGGLGGGESAAPGPSNPAPNGPGMTHVPVPFYLSSAGYGLWIDTSYRTAFSFASEDPSLVRIEAEEPRLRYTVFVYDDPRRTLADFTARVGRAHLQAPWVFGPRRRVDIGATAAGMPEETALRKLGVPTTAIDDTTHFLPNGSGYDRPAELKAWTDRLHGLGYKAIGYFNGHVSATKPEAASLLADGRAKNVFVRLDDGSEFQTFMISGGGQHVVTLDLTNPAAIDWFQQRLDGALDLGYDGWMLDFGEYLPQRARLANGMSGWEAHNLYPLFLQRATFDHLQRKRGNDFLFFSRSGYTGTQSSTPVVWSGDPSASFDPARGLPAQVRSALTAGLSGIPFWGSDISGFTCLNDPPADKEVYLRWAAFGALSVDMHDENACAGAKDGARKWTLWSDAETTAVYGAFARLHTRLFPYLYAAADEAVRTGLPVMRHPLLMHPEMPEAWEAVDEYWFGPALYAAPVVRRGATARELTLPPGTWFDWWTGISAEGGLRTTRDAPFDVIPLYLRAGRIVAMLPPEVETLAATDDPSVIDMSDRDGVLDVRAALAAPDLNATARLVDGTTLAASLGDGGVSLPPDVTPVDEASLAACARCGRIDPLPDGTLRVRITATDTVAAGGLALSSGRPDKPVRVRWDVLVR
ncbi:MAG TPA: TIM-barrel domain-containing protein [Candidatus Eisenbacteria bacterium]|nr:TIM-barrel domain-containing protein [Candidatus Eisenbacteria bacterium]